MLIARLIADPAVLERGGLEARLDAASAALEAEGLRIAAAAMLDFCGDTLQIALPDGDSAVLRRVLDEYFSPADLLVSTREIEVPRLFVSDMDSTVIEQECIDELADFAGLKDQVSAITERAIVALAERGGPCAAILWGRHAQSLKPLLGDIAWVESVHPSPLSAYRGFFGSKPFSAVNRLLEDQGAQPVDWTLPSYDTGLAG